MAIEEFLTLLEHEARLEAEGLLNDARDEAARRIGVAEAEAAQRQRAFIEQAAAELQGETDHLLAAADRAAREEVLGMRTALLEQVFAEAAVTLERLPGATYAGAIPALVETTLAFLPEEPATIRCRPDVMPTVRDVVGDAKNVRVVDDPTVAAGVLGQADDGSVTVDNPLPQHLRRLHDDLAIAVMARLEATEPRS